MTVPDDAKDTYLTIFKIDGIEINGLSLDVLPIPDGKFENKDTSTYQTGRYQRKGKKTYDPGSVDISGIKIPGDPGQIALQAAFIDTAKHTFQVILTELGVIFQYEAMVMQFKPDADDNTGMFTGQLDASGIFIETVDYAGITALDFDLASAQYPTGIISAVPSTCKHVVAMHLTATATDTVKVTAASASYIGYSLNKGYTWVELTSGAASSSFALGAADSVIDMIIRVDENNKATRFITAYLVRQ